jgi:hypothetical protein
MVTAPCPSFLVALVHKIEPVDAITHSSSFYFLIVWTKSYLLLWISEETKKLIKLKKSGKKS